MNTCKLIHSEARISPASLFFGALMAISLAAFGTIGAGSASAMSLWASSPPLSFAVGGSSCDALGNCDVIVPGAGTGGYDTSVSNFKPYRQPGQFEDPVGDPCASKPGVIVTTPGDPFYLSYANPGQQRVQSSDWWTSLGLQKKTWVSARGQNPYGCTDKQIPPTNWTANTDSFYSEPFRFQFVDFTAPNLFPAGFTPEAGLQIMNLNTATIGNNIQSQGKYNTNLDFLGWGSPAPAEQGVVTVGLAGLHPLRADEFPGKYPPAPPWTYIQVQSYSDWGVVASMHDKSNANQVNITMANGSPFVWFERTKGTAANAPFTLWVGGEANYNLDDAQGSYSVVSNSGTVLIVQVKTPYNANAGLHTVSTALYAIYADAGTWTRTMTNAPGKDGTVAIFQNPSANVVVVAALPHNFTAATAMMAWNTMQPYACNKIVNTQTNFPSPQTIDVYGKSVTLGYDAAHGTVTDGLQVTTQQLNLPGCSSANKNALQLTFPHHRQTIIPVQLQMQGLPALQWNSLLGPVQGYWGNAMYLQLKTRGLVPILPSVAIDDPNITNPTNSNQTAAEDIYETLVTWFFLQEPTAPGKDPVTGLPLPLNLNGFSRNAGTYLGSADNTYINKTTTLREQMVIADQLAQSTNPKLQVIDPRFGKTKAQVAAEMRDVLLKTLEEMIGQWADVYTTQVLQYNSKFNTMYGYPAGYGAVGSLSDHHYHYGYFLRAFAAIGRYDPAWVQKYTQIIYFLQRDVANFDRTAPNFPFMRNFNPYYGHSWADGAAYGGNNQESTSEAINFEVGMIELGEELNNNTIRDWGVLLYEQEIHAAEQYFFNQNADLTDTPSKPSDPCPTGKAYFLLMSSPPVCYNGNWPRSFVTYARATDSSTQRHTLISQVFNSQLTRTTFFDASPFAAYTIEVTPAGPSMLYFARNQAWLQATWNQLTNDNQFYQAQWNPGNPQLGVYQNLVAAIQAMLPASATTGMKAALARINTRHPYYPGAMDTTLKYLAYTLGTIGQVNPNVLPTIPDGEAFTNGGKTTYVAFNNTSRPVSVSFIDATTGNSVYGPTQVPANSLLMNGGGKTTTFTPTPFVPPSNLLYLHADMTMDNRIGTVLLPNGNQSTFPTTNTSIASTYVTVPTRDDYVPNQPQLPPPTAPGKVLTWMGYFSGHLEGGDSTSCMSLGGGAPPVCDPSKTLQAVTRFAIYTDQCLQAPGTQNCTPKQTDGNAVTIRISYYFDSSKCDPITKIGFVNGKPCDPNRQEYYYNVGLNSENTFILNNKLTEYYFAGVNLRKPEGVVGSGFLGTFGLDIGNKSNPAYPLGAPLGDCGGQRADGLQTPYWDPFLAVAPGSCGFWPNVPPQGPFQEDVTKGTVVLEIWGGTRGTNNGQLVNTMAPVPVSVDAGAAMNRASYVEPPYTMDLQPGTPASGAATGDVPVARIGKEE